MKESYHNCVLCQSTYKNETELFLHLLSLVHQKKLGVEHDTDENFFFQCALCSEDLPNLKEFIVHVRGDPHIEKLKKFQSKEDKIEIHQMLMKVQDTFMKKSKKPAIIPQNNRLIDPDKGSGIKKTPTDLHHITEARKNLIKASNPKVETTNPQPHLNQSRNSHAESTSRIPTESDFRSYPGPYYRHYLSSDLKPSSNLDPRPYFDPKSQFSSRPYTESNTRLYLESGFKTYSGYVPRPRFPRHQLRHSYKPRFSFNPRPKSPHSKDFFRNHSSRPNTPRTNFNRTWNKSFRSCDPKINQRFQNHQDFICSDQTKDHLSGSSGKLNGNHVTSHKDDDVIGETHKSSSLRSFNESLMKQKKLTEELRSLGRSLNEDLEAETKRSSSSHKSEVEDIKYQTPPSRVGSEDTSSDVAPRIVILDEIDPINGSNSSTTSEEKISKESKVKEKQKLERDENKSVNNFGSSSSSVKEKASDTKKKKNPRSTKPKSNQVKYKGRSKKRKCVPANSNLHQPESVKNQLQQLACDKQAQQDTLKQLEQNNNDQIEDQHPDKNESCFKEPLPPGRFEIEELFVPVMAPSQSSERQHDLEEFFKIVQQVENQSDQTPNLCSSKEAPPEATSQNSSSDPYEKLLRMSEEEDGLLKDLESLKKQSGALQIEVTEVEAKLKSLMQKQADVSKDVKDKEARLKLIHEERFKLLKNASSKSHSQVESFGADDNSSEPPITSRSLDQMNQSSRSSDQMNQSPRSSDQMNQSPRSSDQMSRSSISSDQMIQSPRSSDQMNQSPRSSDQMIQSPRSSDQMSRSSRSSDQRNYSLRSSNQKNQSSRSSDQKNQSSRPSDQLSYSSRSFESISQHPSSSCKIQTNHLPDVKLSPDSIVSKYLTDQQQEIIRKNHEQKIASIKEEKIDLEGSAFPVPASSDVSSTGSWHSVVNSSFSSCSSRKYREETEFFKLLLHEKRKAQSLDMSLEVHRSPVIYVDVVMNRYLISCAKDLKIIITDLEKRSEVGKMKLCAAPICAVTWEKIVERERIEVSMYVAVNTTKETWKEPKYKVYCIKACIIHKSNSVCNVHWKHKVVVDAKIPITCLLPKKQLLYIGKNNGDIVVYDTDKSQARTVFTYSTGHAVTALAFGRDGGREVIVCATSDYLINLRTADDGLMLKTFQCHSRTIQSIKVKGSVMVSASLDFTAQVHDVVSGRTKLKYMKQHRNCVKSLEIYKDRFVTVCKDNKLRVFSTDKLEVFGDPVEINSVPCCLFVDQCELLDFILPVAYVGCEDGFVKVLGIHELANLSLSQKVRRTTEHNHSCSEISDTSSFGKIDYVHSFNCQV